MDEPNKLTHRFLRAGEDTGDLFVERLCGLIPEGSDEIQLEYFIVRQNSYGTVYGALRQLKLELRARLSALRDLRTAHQKAVWELQDRERALSSFRAWFWSLRRRTAAQMEFNDLVLSIEAIAEKGATVRREYDFLLEIAKAERDKLGRVTPEKIRELQREFWIRKLAASNVASDVVQVLPEDMREAINEVRYPQERKALQ
jgi:hypothetical protein